jgi:hypothetical protein
MAARERRLKDLADFVVSADRNGAAKTRCLNWPY